MNANKIIILLISLILILSIGLGIKIISSKNEESDANNNNSIVNQTNEQPYETNEINSIGLTNNVTNTAIDKDGDEEIKTLLAETIEHRKEVYEHNKKVEQIADNIVLVLELVIGIPMFIGLWKIFKREGSSGWILFLPILNFVELCHVVGVTGWTVLLMLIPKIGGIIFFIIINYKLASKYGKGLGYTLGLTFLPFVFYPLIAFKEK